MGAGVDPRGPWARLSRKEALARLAATCASDSAPPPRASGKNNATTSGKKRRRGPTRLRVVVVDEIDSLLRCAGDALRRVFRVAAGDRSTLALVGIANAADVPRRAFFGDEAEYAAASARVETVVFRPYAYAQLVDIVADRVDASAFAPPALEFCARKVAATTGDARRVLDVCLAAMRVAEAEDATGPVALSHAARAVRETLGTRHGPVAAVATLPHHAHLCLSAALGLAARADDKAFTRSGLAAAYARACPNVGRGVDAQSAADDALGLLEAAGLLGPAPDKRTKAAKRTAPGQAKLRVLVDPEDARKALGAHAKSSALAHLPPGAK